MGDISKVEQEVLKGHDKKSVLKSGALGFFIGLGAIIPGISGSTVALIFKLYDHLIYCLSNLFKRFIKCVLFLLPIFVGAVIGVCVGFVSVTKLLDLLPFATVMLFVGIMSGAFPGVRDEVKDIKPKTKYKILFVVGVVIPIMISVISNLINAAGDGNLTAQSLVDNFKAWQIIIYILIGYMAAIAQLVPGLSVVAILMAFGYFSPLIDTVSLSFWKANPIVFVIYVCIVVGFVLACLTFSKFMSHMLKVSRGGTMYTVLGLALGSIVSMVISTEMMSNYKSWGVGGTKVVLDIVLGIILLIVGLFLGYSLVKFQRKRLAVSVDSKSVEGSQTSVPNLKEESSLTSDSSLKVYDLATKSSEDENDHSQNIQSPYNDE